MAIIEAQVTKPVINLEEEGGNVFYMIALAIRYGKILKMDTKAITKEMMAFDYGNAVFVFNREFGEFFDIRLSKRLTLESIKDSRKKYEKEEKRKNAIKNPDVMKEAYLR